MKYNSPYDIGVGDVVIMTDEDGYKTEHLVLMNYIKGETDDERLEFNLSDLELV